MSTPCGSPAGRWRSATSWWSESTPGVGSPGGLTSTGAVYVTLLPAAPRAAFIAWTRAWMAGGWLAPAMTTAPPACRWEAWRRSAAIASTYCAHSGGTRGREDAAGTFSAAATAYANSSTWLGGSASRWSAVAPVMLGVLSTT